MAGIEDKPEITLGVSQEEITGEELPVDFESDSAISILDLNRLNRMLSRLAGKEFRIAVFTGEAVSNMDEATLTALASCYAKLSREKWYENWTVESAREELKQYFQANEERINLVSLVYQGEEVIGLCLAFIFSASHPGNLGAHFSSSRLSNPENLEATSSWIGQVGGKEKMISIRELGVLNQYTKIRAPLLCAPVYCKALEMGCKYIFLRTTANSKSLKWSLGIGFVPEHYYVVNEMLLMLGNLEKTVRDFEFRILDYFADQLSTILDQDRNIEALMQQTELDYSEKMKVMRSLSANIAHEMRTPLSGVRASMEGLEAILPQLLDAYSQMSMKNPEDHPAIRADRIGILKNTPERITLMIDQANSVIDMLLMNLRDNTIDRKQFGIYSAADCIRQAIDRYPFKQGEQEKITLVLEDNFYFRGIDSVFIFVIFNLLKNALYSLHAALKGDISISLKSGKAENSMVFRDTGEGMEKSVQEKAFNNFYSSREEGTGVGLSFCQRTIHSFGGDIECRSEPGEFTEFVISLPIV